MTTQTEVDDQISRILRTFDTITVVGASAVPTKAAHYVPEHMQTHGWRIIPINPAQPDLFGRTAFATLADVDEAVDFVNVFRPSDQTPEIVRQAVAVGARAVWLQQGIRSAVAREIAESAGLLYVEDRCLLQEQRRLGISAPTRQG